MANPSDPYGYYTSPYDTTYMDTSSPTALADSAARNAYYNAQAQGVPASQALEQAKFAWQQKLDESTQTGMWNGQWSNPQEQWYTSQFGQWYGPGGAPAAGTLTQA